MSEPEQAIDIAERVGGPHEWGYRDVTDGTFIRDDAPFDACAEIERLRDVIRDAFQSLRDYEIGRAWNIFQNSGVPDKAQP